MEIITNLVEETRALGSRIAKIVNRGECIVLSGDLGCGKTEFVRGFVAGLHSTEIVKSPSFALVNTYITDTFPIHHFDFYRLNYSDELFEIGYDEYIDDIDAFSFIEWGEMFPEVLPKDSYFIKFTSIDESTRKITLDKRIITLLF